jgi:large subunit ribosomal protein L29
MKKSKKINYKGLALEDLNKKLKDFKTELFNLRFQLVVNQLENPSRIRTVKKEVAKILTEINSQKKTVKA